MIYRFVFYLARAIAIDREPYAYKDPRALYGLDSQGDPLQSLGRSRQQPAPVHSSRREKTARERSER